MDILMIIVLLVFGILVGFINTLSAGGTTISIALYLALGLPAQSANAVNRIGVLLQDAFGSALFYKQGLFKLKEVIPCAIPVMIGALLGALTAVNISERMFSICLAVILLIMIFFLFTEKYIKPKQHVELTIKRYVIYFPIFLAIGFYGGFVQAGTGFLLIAALSLLLGYDMLKTAAVKLAMMFLYTVVAISVFFLRGGVSLEYWIYGLIHSIGMIIGTWIADRYALRKGAKMIRWVIIFVIVITSLNLFGILDFNQLFLKILR